MIAADPRNRDVLFPYLNGDDLNSSPIQSASRWIINFFDWTEEKARTYPLPFAKIERDVKPERATKDRTKYPKMVDQWWRYWNERPGLYGAISDFERVTVVARVSNTAQPIRVSARQVFDDKIVVFASNACSLLGLVSSEAHRGWLEKSGTTLGAGAGLTYASRHVFETFPAPPDMDSLQPAGAVMESARNTLMLQRGVGLTAAYNLVNDESCMDADVVALREAHEQLDQTVLAAYGWDDLKPAHGFFDTDQGVRYCMDRATTAEVLDRLLELNKERYEAEVAKGLHGKSAKKAVPAKRVGTAKGVAEDAPSLFD